EALREMDGVSLAIIGGPDEMVDTLRQRWIAAGLDAGRFLAAGQVPPAQVPLYLSACDVCALPHPWTKHFAYYTSPIKLFEYMAARRAIVASDLPGFAEVLREGESALLVPPGDVGTLTAAIQRLRDDPALRSRLADSAYEQVMAHYTWEARAKAIQGLIEGNPPVTNSER
ncbi:MAG: glycosyltransferase, partial [Chloroflexi bacterium]|nr:glycosyltransferase [Chloroflexota bacterium]